MAQASARAFCLVPPFFACGHDRKNLSFRGARRRACLPQAGNLLLPFRVPHPERFLRRVGIFFNSRSRLSFRLRAFAFVGAGFTPSVALS